MREPVQIRVISERQAIPARYLEQIFQRLRRAGIVTSERDGRHIIYRADFDAVGQLIVYLLEDCCGGSAEVCAPVAASIRC